MAEQLWVGVFQPVLTWLHVPRDSHDLATAEDPVGIESQLHSLTPDRHSSQHKPHLELLVLRLSWCTLSWFPTAQVQGADVALPQAWVYVLVVVPGPQQQHLVTSSCAGNDC